MSKHLFLFSSGCSSTPSLPPQGSRHGGEQGLPGSRASQVWDPKLKKAPEVSEGFVSSVSCLVTEGSGERQYSPPCFLCGSNGNTGLVHSLKLSVPSGHLGLMVGGCDGLFSKGLLFLEVSHFKETMCACSFLCLKTANNRS